VEPYPEARMLAAAEHPFAVPYVYQRYTMLIESAIYLNALIRDSTRRRPHRDPRVRVRQ
jgi:hypothetical protein